MPLERPKYGLIVAAGDDTPDLSVITDQLAESIEEPLDFLHRPARAKASARAAATTLANNTYTAISFDTEEYDTANMFGGGGTRLVATVPGWYDVRAHAALTPNATGIRYLSVYKNGTLYQPDGPVSQAGNAAAQVLTNALDVYLAAGDYIEMWAYQNSGGSLGTSIGGGLFCSLSARWVST